MLELETIGSILPQDYRC